MKRFLLLLLSLPLQSGFLSASDKAKQDAVALIQEAEARTDIFALPTFVMKADLRLDNQGKPIEGKYLLLWNGPDHWREEISVPGYRQIQVGGKGGQPQAGQYCQAPTRE